MPLFVFEGIDGVGKTTQLAAVAEALRRRGHDVVTSREPTTGPHGMQLRESKAAGRLDPDSELELFVADRRDHVESLVQPALDRGQVVLLDRYYLSTAAYQGARGKDPYALLVMNETFAPRPSLAIILDARPTESLARIQREHDSFEDPAALERARGIFLELAEALPWVSVVDANQSEADVTRSAVALIEPLIRDGRTEEDDRLSS